MKYIKSAKLSLGVVALYLSACAHQGASIDAGLAKTAEIMKKEQTGVAILLNKGGGMSVVGVDTGQEFFDCNRNKQIKSEVTEASQKKCLSLDGVKILQDRTISVKIFEGSLCVDIVSGSARLQLCSPPDGPYPESVIKALLPQ